MVLAAVHAAPSSDNVAAFLSKDPWLCTKILLQNNGATLPLLEGSRQVKPVFIARWALLSAAL